MIPKNVLGVRIFRKFTVLHMSLYHTTSWKSKQHCNPAPKFLERQVLANNVDPDQTALEDWGLHYLPFCLHLLDALTYVW